MQKFDNFKTMTRELIKFVFNSLPELDYSNVDRGLLSINLFHRDTTIIASKEYIEAMKEALRFTEFTSHFDKLIGTVSSQTAISGPHFIQSFIMWCIWENNTNPV